MPHYRQSSFTSSQLEGSHFSPSQDYISKILSNIFLFPFPVVSPNKVNLMLVQIKASIVGSQGPVEEYTKCITSMLSMLLPLLGLPVDN